MKHGAIRRRGLWFICDVITQAELRHQWYVLEKSRSGILWIIIAILMLLPAIFFTIYFGMIALLNLPAPQWNPSNPASTDLLINIGLISSLVMNISLYLIVILITLGLSSNSITRERKGKTWDVLLLTNVDAHQVILGKWWASLVALWGDHAMVAFIRIGMVTFAVVSLEPYFGDAYPPRHSASPPYWHMC